MNNKRLFLIRLTRAVLILTILIATIFVNMQDKKNVQAKAAEIESNLSLLYPGPETVDVNIAGTGTGKVVSSPAGIDCPTTCSAQFVGFYIDLTATPDPGVTFVQWLIDGVPDSTNPVLTLNLRPVVVTAVFQRNQFYLTTSRTGTSTGTITSTPAGIDCGSTCGALFDPDTSVTLDAVPGNGAMFVQWTVNGLPGSTNPSLIVMMDKNQNVLAVFDKLQYSLTVARDGTGSGTVTSTPSNIDCGSTCSKLYDPNTSVQLTAAPASSSQFDGWDLGTGGALDTTNPISITMDQNKTVKAVFTHVTHSLTIEKIGTGSGSVTSAPAGIDCGSSCMAIFDLNSSVELTATPTASSLFDGWDLGGGGALVTTNPLPVMMSTAKTVKAQFSAKQTDLEVKLEAVHNSWKSYTFTVTVLNHSAYPISGAKVVEAPLNFEPGGWTCVGVSGGACTTSGSGKIDDSISLPPNASVVYTIEYHLTRAYVNYVYEITASVPAGVVELSPANNQKVFSGSITTLVVIMYNPLPD